MTTIKDILQFHFSPNALRHAGRGVIPINLNALIEFRIDKLEKITNDIGESDYNFSGESLIPDIFRRFKESVKTKNFIFERRELRTLTYSFSYSEKRLPSIISQIIELKHALKLLDNNWKDSFLVGLIDCLLQNWETKHRKSLEYLEEYIFEKLKMYNGLRTSLISFKNNRRFFSVQNGDLILGDVIARQNRPIKDSTKILGVPESWFVYPYFSKVILTFYERNKANILIEFDELITVIVKHNNSVTSKRLISKIIIQLNRGNFVSLQDKIKNTAFSKIGDPANSINWAPFETATEIEKSELIEARNILNEWITKQFIDVFFRVCINDERRKRFWLSVASRAKLTFKVYGSLRTKYILKMDDKIAQYVEARFETVSSNKDVSAFILYIGNHMLIEFSESGYACCAYNINSNNCPELNYKLKSVDDLRNSNLSMAISSDNNYYYHNDEGRLFHKDGSDIWEVKFNDWLDRIALK